MRVGARWYLRANRFCNYFFAEVGVGSFENPIPIIRTILVKLCAESRCHRDITRRYCVPFPTGPSKAQL